MRKKILIVDDIPGVRLLYRKFLEGHFELDEAENGLEALSRIDENPPDLVILDVLMPKMDGIECCRRIKSDKVTKHLPIIVVSTLGNYEHRAAAIAAGCDSYLQKPIRKDWLLGKIWLVLELSSRRHDS